MPECTEAERKLIEAVSGLTWSLNRLPPAVAQAMATVNAERVESGLTAELRDEAIRVYSEYIRAAAADTAMDAKLTELFGVQVCEGGTGLIARLFDEAEKLCKPTEPK